MSRRTESLIVAGMLAASILVSCSIAYAKDIKETMWEHLAWITANSVYDMPDRLPTVIYRSAEMLQIQYYGPERVAQAEYNGHYLPDVLALYDPATETMFLPTGYDHTDVDTGATLVHELVHHLQTLNGRYDEYECLAEGEPEAYAIHNEWIDYAGSAEEHTNPLWLLMLESACHPERQGW